ncbi:uncharacterized protein V1510DRAFT_309176 [Dipodascopsis tothii]|uniref:uncharacterized protein n=1 Tax=Dipodascopsis tothii TaxID=44089 RepID=UPI0034CD3070
MWCAGALALTGHLCAASAYRLSCPNHHPIVRSLADGVVLIAPGRDPTSGIYGRIAWQTPRHAVARAKGHAKRTGKPARGVRKWAEPALRPPQAASRWTCFACITGPPDASQRLHNAPLLAKPAGMHSPSRRGTPSRRTSEGQGARNNDRRITGRIG